MKTRDDEGHEDPWAGASADPLATLPERRADEALVEGVRRQAHACLRRARPTLEDATRAASLSVAAGGGIRRGADAVLSALVAGIAVVYVGWALDFTSRLFH